MVKKIALLGATGSIGANTLDVIDNLSERLSLVAVSARANWEKLAEIVRRYGVMHAAVTDADAAERLKQAVPECEVYSGKDALVDIVRASGADTVLVGVTGASGLRASLETVRSGKTLALANKESLVMSGPLLIWEAARNNTRILPVDSEHSAIFQALLAGLRDEVSRIVLTASGGPFRTRSAAELENVTAEEALNHPTWNMGPKITIDSATLMNKALEVVEAHALFNMPPERIDVVVHPESIVHSMVVFRDGSTIAQMGPPDMRVPIQYALTYPERLALDTGGFSPAAAGALTFEEVDRGRFPAIDLAYEVCRRGGTSGAVLNAANEEAVKLFLGGKIKFTEITRSVAEILKIHETAPAEDLEAIFKADAWAREEVGKWHASL
jgi:1-deoxy-D-xylulose-5-phosphate reductoisomerase